jgi:hypothetical protein
MTQISQFVSQKQSMSVKLLKWLQTVLLHVLSLTLTISLHDIIIGIINKIRLGWLSKMHTQCIHVQKF